MILAIDPGPTESAWLALENGTPATWAKSPNVDVLEIVEKTTAELVAIEMIASYGMPVGAEVFETVLWIGRFIQALGRTPHVLLKRKEVVLHLCNSPRGNDASVRQALVDRFGAGMGKAVAIGKKASPGPLFGISGDCWSALAVAITAYDRKQGAQICAGSQVLP